VNLAYCYICPGDLVVDGESGHIGTVVQVKGDYALVGLALLGQHWIPLNDLEPTVRRP
jgi:hypothetical protein